MTADSLPLPRCSVVDLTAVRPGLASTRTLADLGARVLRVERPGGEHAERIFALGYEGAVIDAPLTGDVSPEHPGGQA